MKKMNHPLFLCPVRAPRAAALAAAAVLAFSATAFPCFSITAMAQEKQVSRITTEYDDGTREVTEYQYDQNGNNTVKADRYRDGSTRTITRSYGENGDAVSEQSVYYDAETNTTYTYESIQRDVSPRSYYRTTTEYGDGTWEQQETWGDSLLSPTKEVTVSVDGITTQTDYTYNETGQLLTERTVSSDGSWAQGESVYGENGELLSYYDAAYTAQTGILKERTLSSEGTGPAAAFRLLVTSTSPSGNQTKEESWHRPDDLQVTKKISFFGDASTVEEYSYDRDGLLSYYVKRDGESGRLIADTRNTRSPGMEEIISTDELGTMTTSRTVSQVGITSTYSRTEAADGAYSCTEYSTRDADGAYLSYRSEDGDENGPTSSQEILYSEDGSYTSTSRSADGAVTVSRYNASHSPLSQTVTKPDGRTETTVWEYREDGLPARKVTSYSDGTGDTVVTYQYDDTGTLTDSTETRANGMSAVTRYWSDYDGDGDFYQYQEDVTYNGGQSLSRLDEESWTLSRSTITYSTGDIAQEMLEADYTGDNPVYRHRISYRDGNTEERVLAGDLEYWNRSSELETRVETYLETGWMG